MPDIQDEAAALRRPPQSIPSEQAILGGLMVDNSAFDAIAGVVKPEDFCRRDHRTIFEHISLMIQRGEPADSLTVFESLKNAGHDAAVGGLPYITELIGNTPSAANIRRYTPSAANIRRYAEIVHEKAVLRQLITVGDEIVTSALEPEGRDTRDILNDAERKVLAINERNAQGQRGFQPMGTLLKVVSARVIESYNNRGSTDVTGVSTGYRNLDHVTAGLQRGDLIIIAGRPSMGKTSLALNIAENIGVDQDLPVAVFSMEMGSEQLAQRLVSSVGRIDAQKLRKGQLSDEDWDNFTAALHRLETKPIYIDDTPGLTITELSSRARRLVSQVGPLGLIVVDYIQLMTGQGRSANENRAQELSEISRGLKSLAKELQVPLIALSQLNRGVDSRSDRRPVMSDLRESGAIEQDADIVMFIHRPDKYADAKEMAEGKVQANVAEILIEKHRNGPTGVVKLYFKGECTKFLNLTEEVVAENAARAEETAPAEDRGWYEDEEPPLEEESSAPPFDDDIF